MATKGDISDLDELIFGGKPIVPQVAIGGYSMYKRTGVTQNDVAGGATRQRRRFHGTPIVASATFFLETPEMQDFIRVFIERNIGKYFVCHTEADRKIVEPYVVQVLGDWDESDINAVDSTVTVTMEIISVRDPDLDDSLYVLYTGVENVEGSLLSLEHLVETYPL